MKNLCYKKRRALKSVQAQGLTVIRLSTTLLLNRARDSTRHGGTAPFPEAMRAARGPSRPTTSRPRIPGLGVGCWLFSSWSWVTSRQLGKAGAPRKKVDFEFSPNLPNPPDSILFLMLVFLDKERGPARY